MKNIKQIWEENKTEMVVGAMVGVAVGSALLTRRFYHTNFKIIPKEFAAIVWKPSGKFISLENAKAALDLNVNNDSSFAVFKNGKKYVGILLSDGVILP